MTTKQELIEQQNKLQDELDKLKELIENTPDDKYKRPRAKYGELYYFIDNCGEVGQARDYEELWDLQRYNSGNYYLGEKYCKYIAKCKLTKQKLKDLALRLNKGEEMDWKQGCQFKWSFYYDLQQKKLCKYFVSIVKNLGQVYCLDEKFLQIAKQEIGEEELIKLIKSGV